MYRPSGAGGVRPREADGRAEWNYARQREREVCRDREGQWQPAREIEKAVTEGGGHC